MVCLHDKWRKHAAARDNDKLVSVHELQNKRQLYKPWKKAHPRSGIEKWHVQATYNMAVRQELRRRHLPITFI